MWVAYVHQPLDSNAIETPVVKISIAPLEHAASTASVQRMVVNLMNAMRIKIAPVTKNVCVFPMSPAYVWGISVAMALLDQRKSVKMIMIAVYKAVIHAMDAFAHLPPMYAVTEPQNHPKHAMMATLSQTMAAAVLVL